MTGGLVQLWIGCVDPAPYFSAFFWVDTLYAMDERNSNNGSYSIAESHSVPLNQ